MSNTDSFIDEVNEELRRDQMTGYLRKYGWIAVVAILVIVGGTAYNEYRKASLASAAQAKGDAITAALESGDAAASAAALAELGGPDNVVAAFLASAQFEAAGDIDAAVAALSDISSAADVDPIYSDLAALKSVMLGSGDDANRGLVLDGLARPGGPYRTLALELQALDEVALGNVCLLYTSDAADD